MKPVDRIKRARVQLEGSASNDYEDGNPFFAYLTRHLTLVESEQVPTMGVSPDGKLYYNPEFVEDMTEEQVKGVLCHEVLHVALEHFMRTGNRNHQLSNVAQDVLVNFIVLKNGLEIPEDAIKPDHRNEKIELEQWDIEIKNLSEQSFESVYDTLRRKNDELEDKIKQDLEDDKDGNSQGDGQGQGGQPSGQQGNQSGQGTGDGGGEDVLTPEQQEDVGNNPSGFDEHIYKGEDGEDEVDADMEDGKDWEEIMSKAMAKSKQMGSMPAGMERRVEELLAPSLTWKTVLRRYVSKEITSDFTYQRPSKTARALRKQGHNTYLPDTKKEGLEVVVTLDTSGSVGREELQHYLGEMNNIADSYEQVNMIVVQHDADITKVDDISNVTESDLENLEIKGGGGTNHKPVFKWIENNQPQADIMIALTDGYTQAPETAPRGMDVFWVLDNREVEKDRLNFGTILRADFNH